MAIRMPFGGGPVAVRFGRRRKFPIEISKYDTATTKRSAFSTGAPSTRTRQRCSFCEKLRAICQQTPEYAELVKRTGRPRGRDFLDIHVATEYFRLDFRQAAFQDTLRKNLPCEAVFRSDCSV